MEGLHQPDEQVCEPGSPLMRCVQETVEVVADNIWYNDMLSCQWQAAGVPPLDGHIIKAEWEDKSADCIPCACDADGHVGGVATGHAGCAADSFSATPWCYVADSCSDGGYEQQGGAGKLNLKWKYCSPGDPARSDNCDPFCVKDCHFNCTTYGTDVPPQNVSLWVSNIANFDQLSYDSYSCRSGQEVLHWFCCTAVVHHLFTSRASLNIMMAPTQQSC